MLAIHPKHRGPLGGDTTPTLIGATNHNKDDDAEAKAMRPPRPLLADARRGSLFGLHDSGHGRGRGGARLAIKWKAKNRVNVPPRVLRERREHANRPASPTTSPPLRPMSPPVIPAVTVAILAIITNRSVDRMV